MSAKPESTSIRTAADATPATGLGKTATRPSLARALERACLSLVPVTAGMRWAWVAIFLAVIVLARPTERHLRAAGILLGLDGATPIPLGLLETGLGIETVVIPTGVTPGGTVHGRVYRPVGELVHLGAPRGVVLVHGVHYLGIDEPRLVSLARGFARAGLVVLTPELEALADYRVDDPANLDALRVSVRYLARRTDLVKRGGVGLIGVSFAGGLSIRVASEPTLDGELAFVASVGGHHDMRRVARFFVTDRVATPDAGEVEGKAHDYGLAVLVYSHPEKFVPSDDVPHLRRAVRAFLHETYGAADQAALALSPEGRAFYDHIARRDRLALADRVIEALPSLAQAMDNASPAGNVGRIRVPVFLLHGAHDDVVPPSESRWIAREATGSPVVRVLVSAKIGHAELGEGGAWESLRLVHFIAEMIDG